MLEGQVHDFNPGVTPRGLFWTTEVSPQSVRARPDGTRAVMDITEIQQKDHFTFENAILGHERPLVGRVSFKVRWDADGPVQSVDNPVQRYRGEVRPAIARMEWSGRTRDYVFRSAPLADSTTDAAQLGFESNGSFY
jgi:hypothetical protein